MTLRESIRLADATKHDAVRARAFVWLTGVVGYDLEKPAEGLVLADDTRATLERLGGDDRLLATLESNLGRIYSVTGDYQKMFEHHDAALQLRRKIYGEDDPNTANSQNNVAAALHELGRITDALAGHRKALAMRIKTLGADHPNVAMSLSNIANQHYELGDLVEGVRVVDEALAIGKRSLPVKSSLVMISMANRAAMLGALGRFDESKATFDELVGTLRADQPKSLRMVRALARYAKDLLVPSKHAPEALAMADEAIGLLAKDAQNEEMAMALGAKADALEALGKLDEAAAAHRASLAIYEKIVGKDAPALIDALTKLGRIAFAKGNEAEAIDTLSRAIAICQKATIGGKWLAEAQFELARASARSDAKRAKELATAARAWYATVPTLAQDVAAIDALITHL